MKNVTIVLLFLAIALTSCNKTDDFSAGMAFYDKQDYKNALPFLEKSAAQGNAQAQNVLGCMYENGDGVPQDIKTAILWYEKAATLGSAAAQFNLGILYDVGKGVSQDYKKAAFWYEKSAAQGRAQAQYNLGIMYRKGDGVPQDYEQGMVWIKKAADQGDEMAKKILNNRRGYILQPRETALLNFIIKEDYNTYEEGGSSALNWGSEDVKKFLCGNIPAVSIAEVAKAYEENQVAGDKKYFKKKFRIAGAITGINSGIGNSPYLTFQGRNPFMMPQAHFNNDNIERIAGLKKGQKITLVCDGAGSIAGIAMFDNCQFADDYVAVKTKEYIEKFLSGEQPKSEEVSFVNDVIITAVGTIAYARMLPETSTCFSDGSKCSNELKLLKKENMGKYLTAIIPELKSAGVQIPPSFVLPKHNDS